MLKGTTRAYDPDIHAIRPHPGQQLSALRLRSLLHSDANPSQIAESHRNCGKVQDAYTLRCVPQVHGVVHDTIEFVREIIRTEMNSATDNPLVFADREEIISGGNFHGEYPAKASYICFSVRVFHKFCLLVNITSSNSIDKLVKIFNHFVKKIARVIFPENFEKKTTPKPEEFSNFCHSCFG